MRSLSILTLLLLTSITFAQRNAKIPDPDPEIERKTFIVPDGFEVSLWAADPLLAKPIQMNFDSKGRLWVASSEVYPQIKPGQKADDKILILEDTTGKGTADKTTIFARGLLIPTAVEPDQFGGCYAADSTDLVHFSKPNDKGESTVKRIVLSGFGTEDTHHILHTFRTGPDCRLYMSQSIYIHSHIETPHGVRRLNAGGIWQFQPETEKLEVFVRGWVNTWGTAWDKHGVTFATDGAGGEGINYVVPGGAYVTARDVARILPGLNPGSPKYCGLEVVSGRHLPDDWQQNLITNDFRGHRVCRYIVQEDGSGFVAKEQKEVIKSTHPAFRPIDVKMGPDGAIYIADWYNPIIQHGEVDFRDERRDKTHGRIWKVTAKGRPLVEKPKISGANGPDLLELLKSPEDWTRNHARRELALRDWEKMAPHLGAWIAKNPGDAALLEVLWLAQAKGEADFALNLKLVDSKNPNLRAAACRVLAEMSFPDWTAAHLEKRTTDDHPRVRLEAVRAVARLSRTTAEEKIAAANAIAAALEKPMDKWLEYAIWLSLRETKDEWLPKVKDGSFDFGGDPKKLVFALKAVDEANTGVVLANLLIKGRVEKTRIPDVLLTICEVGNAKDIQFAIIGPHEQPETLRKVLAAAEKAIRTRKLEKTKLAGDELVRLITESTDDEIRRSAARILGYWKHEPARNAIEALAQSDLNRSAAYEAIASLGGPKSVEFLQNMAKAPNTYSRAELAKAFDHQKREAMIALASLDLSSAANIAVGMLNVENAESIFNAFISRKGGSTALAKALSDTKLSADVAKVGVRIARGSAQPDQALIDALSRAGQLDAAKKPPTKAELEQMLTDVKAQGDPVRGEAVYRRAELNCLKCHGIAGAGGQVGPDMTSIGASAQVDYLIESLLNPNAKIKEGYNSFIVNTDDGSSFSGIKVRETGKEIVFRDNEDKLHTVLKADKPDVKPGQSLMPVGLTDALTRQEFVDLVRFLSELGKGAYLGQAGKVVRRWETVQPTKELFTAVTRDRLAAVATATDLSWAPVYSRVGGGLPLDDTAKWKIGDGVYQSVVRFQLDVTTAGDVALNIADTTGLTMWVDGAPVTVEKTTPLKLTQGVRTITIHTKLNERKEPLRVELGEVKNSPARVAIVGGK
jgi:putative heme-binding domain-containing protein